MAMYANCPKCGSAVEINKILEAHGKGSQRGPEEPLPNTSVACPNCKNSFLPKNPFVKQG